MALLLMQKIIALFLIMAAGFTMVKCKILKSSDNKILSLLLMYLFTPCTIIASFQVDCTPEVQSGLLLAAGAAVCIHVILIVLNLLLRNVLKLNVIEQAALIYSNAGNLVIPLVSSVLGAQWVIYTSAYIAVQQLLMWTHMKSMICRDSKFDLKKILTNINVICIAAGLVLFFTGIRFPAPIENAVESLGGMIGPTAMLVTGILIGGISLKNVFAEKRVWLIAFLRLVLVPLITLVFLKFSGITTLAPNGADVLLITYIATITPSASTITSMASVYDTYPTYAASVNVVTAIACIATMPLMISLYLM